jgi:hypothetical protein
VEFISHSKKPDRYAAAICIKVRPGGLSCGICRRYPCLSALQAHNGLTRYPGCELVAESYFFFRLDIFFAVFLDAFAVFDFFAFLAMFPSSLMLAQCKSTFDMHTLRLHHNCKIDTARFEEGKQQPHRRNLRPESVRAD